MSILQRVSSTTALRPADSCGLYALVVTDFLLNADECIVTSGTQVLTGPVAAPRLFLFTQILRTPLRLESALLSFPSAQGLEVSVALAGGCLPLDGSGSTSRRPAATTLGMCRIGVVLLLCYFLSVTDEFGLVLATQVTMNAARVELA